MSIQEIEDLLERVLVFEVSFKKNILERSRNLNEAKLSELKNILLEVNKWQKIVLDKIAKEDPEFIGKLANNKIKAEQELMNLYKQKLEEDDRKKMEIILGKIRSV